MNITPILHGSQECYIQQKITTMSHLFPTNVQHKKVKRLEMALKLKKNQTLQTELFVASNKSTEKQIKASIFSDFRSPVNPNYSQGVTHFTLNYCYS